MRDASGTAWPSGALVADPRLARAVSDLARRANLQVAPPRGETEAHELLDRIGAALLQERALGLLGRQQELQGALRRSGTAAREMRTKRLRGALARVSCAAGPDRLWQTLVSELGALGLQRVMLTEIADGVGVPTAYAGVPDPAWEREILRVGREHPMQLDELPVENGLTRNRAGGVLAPAVQEDPRIHRHLADVTACRAYVAAPVVTGGRVVALLHADAHFARRLVDDDDAAILWACAAAAGTSWSTRDAAGAPSGLHTLTARERDVLDLLVRGATNAAIAEALVVSPATAKTHVANILRKLGAANRAEAVARALSS